MARLHFFFPENDLALALDIARYTPPPAASRLRRSGSTLGLWYGDEGDRVADEGVDAAWYRHIRSRFGLAPALYDGDAGALTPAPWGWSKASRTWLRQLGFAPDALPSDSALARMRDLSHRRSSVLIAKALQKALPFAIAPAAVELTDIDSVRRFVADTGQSVLKLPWSSSGRGLILINPADMASHEKNIEATLRRHGSILGEKRHDKTSDFAMLFTMAHGRCTYDGLSVFRTEHFGAYTGNILAPEATLRDMIGRHTDGLDEVATALPPILESIIGTDYDGPLGIDMMTVNGDGYTLAPAVELNLRMTMGHVARIFYDKHIAPGHTATLTVENRGAGTDTTVLSGGRIAGGTLSLSTPGSPFSFTIRAE